MQSIAVHGARPTDPLTAGASEGKSGVLIFLDVEKSIKVHGWDFFEVNIIADIFWFVAGVLGVVSVDEEAFHLGLIFGGERRIMFDDVIRIEITLNS